MHKIRVCMDNQVQLKQYLSMFQPELLKINIKKSKCSNEPAML